MSYPRTGRRLADGEAAETFIQIFDFLVLQKCSKAAKALQKESAASAYLAGRATAGQGSDKLLLAVSKELKSEEYGSSKLHDGEPKLRL